MGALRLYNSLAREKQDFTPIDADNVRLYACGPTVYGPAHIGNARAAVVFDQLYRLLQAQFPKVTYVRNITDIDDKIITAMQETGESLETITNKWAEVYNADMASLGCLPPTHQPRATETIPEMLALIQTLIDKGHAYEKDGHVLFNVPSYDDYGALSGRSRDEQIAGARVEVAPYKEDPADFVLWKPSSDDEPGWDSPYGRGRPGWHLECSAMAEKFLGLPFDIHGGGADLKFPHHENEIAQSCCAHSSATENFARFWVHNGFLTVEGEKMSKSLGNFTLPNDLLEQGIPGEVIRLTLLSAHYRQPLDWSEAALHQSQKTLDRFYRALEGFDASKAENQNIPPAVLDALNDDMNVPLAITHMIAIAKEVGTLDGYEKTDKQAHLYIAGKLLGLLSQTPSAWFADNQDINEDDAAKYDALLAERETARKEKDFARADEIRDRLATEGIVIEDTPQGPKWKKG